MSIGTYGIVRPADVSINDIDVFYNYTPNRQTSNTDIFRLNATEILSQCFLPEDEQIIDYDNILEGMYNLTLPATIFTDLGIYTIYIKPKTIPIVISDCGVLSSVPTIKGIIIDSNDLPTEELATNNALQGYRIEYLNSDGTKLRNVVRYIVTSNKVTSISENVGNTSQKAIRYRFDDSGTLIFLQVTPSSSSDVKPNALPFIGVADQIMLMSNTYFNPVMIEVELVENTIDTLSDIVAGEQVKNVQTGVLTHYDKNREITKQFNLFEIKDDVTNVPLYEVKEKRTNIDETQDFNEIISDVQ